MSARKHSPDHDFWHARLEPPIREVIKLHPRWFAFRDDNDRHAFVNSVAKRVVGQVIAGMREKRAQETTRLSPPDASLAPEA